MNPDIRLTDEYKTAHRCCPSCGSTTVMTTCMGFGLMSPGIDNNSATCACGWRGIKHDMKPLTLDTSADKA